MAPPSDGTAMVARLDQLSRIAALARSDMEIYAPADGNDSALEPPWIHRRRRALEALQQQQRQDQMASMAMERFEPLQRQLEEQGRQLEALAVRRNGQEMLQQQLITLLNKVQEHEKLGAPKQEHRPGLHYVSHVQRPQEHHTIAWLNSQKPHHRQKHDLSGGFRPIRKRWGSRSLASEQTRTTGEGVGRLCRVVESNRSRSTVSAEPSEHSDRSKKHAESKAETSSNLDEDVHIVGRKKTPVVAALYARCLRKARKKASSRTGDRSERDSYGQASSRSMEQEHTRATKDDRTFDHEAGRNRSNGEKIIDRRGMSVHFKMAEKRCRDSKSSSEVPELKRPTPEMDDSQILANMLSLQKQEDERHWLVGEAQKSSQHEENRDTLLNEIAKLRAEGTAYRSGTEERKIYASEWLTRAFTDDAVEDVAKELWLFCEDFVDHLYCSEFIDV